MIVADRTTVELNPEACVTDVTVFGAALRFANQARHGPEYAARLPSFPSLPAVYLARVGELSS